MRAQEVDRLPEGKAKGVGMCVGPIFSSTPTALDWLQYYAGKTLPQCTCRLNEYLQHEFAYCQAALATHVSLGRQCTATRLSCMLAYGADYVSHVGGGIWQQHIIGGSSL